MSSDELESSGSPAVAGLEITQRSRNLALDEGHQVAQACKREVTKEHNILWVAKLTRTDGPLRIGGVHQQIGPQNHDPGVQAKTIVRVVEGRSDRAVVRFRPMRLKLLQSRSLRLDLLQRESHRPPVQDAVLLVLWTLVVDKDNSHIVTTERKH